MFVTIRLLYENCGQWRKYFFFISAYFYWKHFPFIMSFSYVIYDLVPSFSSACLFTSLFIFLSTLNSFLVNKITFFLTKEWNKPPYARGRLARSAFWAASQRCPFEWPPAEVEAAPSAWLRLLPPRPRPQTRRAVDRVPVGVKIVTSGVKMRLPRPSEGLRYQNQALGVKIVWLSIRLIRLIRLICSRPRNVAVSK